MERLLGRDFGGPEGGNGGDGVGELCSGSKVLGLLLHKPKESHLICAEWRLR